MTSPAGKAGSSRSGAPRSRPTTSRLPTLAGVLVRAAKWASMRANADLSGERLVFEGGPALPIILGRWRAYFRQGNDKFYVMNSDGSGIHAVDLGEYPAWSPIDN